MMYIITFQSTHHVLKAEKILLAAGVEFDIIPTPKNISSECGMSIRLDAGKSDKEYLEKILQNENIYYNFHHMTS